MRRLFRRLRKKALPSAPVLNVQQSNAEHEEILRRKAELENRVYRLQQLSDLRSRTSEERR